MKSILDFIKLPDIKSHPNSSAIILSDKKITYDELSSLIDKTVSFFSRSEIKKNDIVTLLFNNSLEFIVTIISLWKIGAIPVPLNPKLLEKDLMEQIIFLNSSITIKSEEFKNTVLGKSLFFSLDLISVQSEIPPTKITSPGKTALILFTSGSSGKPKAVVLSFNNHIQSALIGNKVLNQSNDDRWLASLPFYHIGGFSIIFRALMFGASIIIPGSLSNNDLIQTIKKHKPTLASLVSNQLKNFVDLNFIPPKELRTVLLGGGFSDRELVLQAINKGWKIAKVYGSTETSSFISFMNFDEVKKKPEASGKVIPPNKIEITNDGEIAVQGPAVMKGYFNNEDETISKLRNDFFFTGDIGYLDDEGYLFVEAKRTNLIITGGENVNPNEVEKVILSNPKVKEVCVVGVEDEKWGQIVSAAVVLKEKSEMSETRLRNYLKDKLASFKIPKRIVFVNQLSKSALGKALRENVRELFEQKF